MIFTFTSVTADSFPAIVELFDANHDDWVGSPDEAWLSNILTTANAQADSIYYENTLIGYLQYTEHSQAIDALAIFIGKEFRGQGFGAQILQQFVESKSQCPEFKAYIDETDFLSTSVFEKAGFVKTGPITDEGIFAFVRTIAD
jgi:RimJ/RimL family protein N-acetyltransferase